MKTPDGYPENYPWNDPLDETRTFVPGKGLVEDHSIQKLPLKFKDGLKELD